MTRTSILATLFIAVLFSISHQVKGQKEAYSLDQVKSYPFPNALVASSKVDRLVWAVNEQGLRNLYVAEGPDFKIRRLTNYTRDDGQELSAVSISADGEWVVYIRGGDFGSNWNDADPVNPTFDPQQPNVQIWSVKFSGEEPVMLGKGESPVISPDGRTVAFVKGGQIWTTPIDGSESARQLFEARGSNSQPQWSPDGRALAFRSSRGGHSFIGVYRNADSPILWVSPAFDRDHTPRWSPDGQQIAFLRQPGSGGAPEPILEDQHNPWQIRVADAVSGESHMIWQAPETLRGNMPTTHGRSNLRWGAGRIVYLSYEDGWPHLYSIEPDGSNRLQLTKGDYMNEYVSMSPDGSYLVSAANASDKNDPLDMDRRHILKIPIDRYAPEVLTPGEGNEWTPVVLGGGKHMAYISATAQRPPLAAVMDLNKKKSELIGEELIPKDFPSRQLVVPTQVVFDAPDGTAIHATMFKSGKDNNKRPAIIYVHGGPPRQMLLGWHYSSYYSNAYAMNQYLASQGYIVLAVNYRLGIGYGYEFHRPVDGGTRGASEYHDIYAAGKWLAQQDFVDEDKIGIYGGSYGGYLTAMALGRNSDLFATGVDIHGVHDRTINRVNRYLRPNSYEKAPDAEKTAEVAWKSSPVAYVDSWTSPVLIIHADDDRNVAFSQSTDLVQRLRKKGVELETKVIVDDTHHFMMHRNQMTVNKAIATYFARKLK